MEAGQPPAKGRSTTIVLSPLNALMRDQISKLGHIGVVVLDDTKETNDLAILQAREGKLQLVFSHSEFVIENTTKSTLKTSTFQKHVRCIVVDEVHLVDDWWVLLFVLLPEVAAMGHSILYPHTPPPIEVLIVVMLVRPLQKKKIIPLQNPVSSKHPFGSLRYPFGNGFVLDSPSWILERFLPHFGNQWFGSGGGGGGGGARI